MADQNQRFGVHAVWAFGERRRTREILGALLLTLIWLWLVSSRVRAAYGNAVHDDALFAGLAGSLTSGRWLGPYGTTTLAKGPFYPIWIAICFGLNLPLQFAENLLYALACAAMVASVAPVFHRPAQRMAMLALLLFSPQALAGTARVLRECIYPALTLLAIAGAIGVALRANRPWPSTRGWAVLLGSSLAFFYLCREDRIWIAPGILLVLIFAVTRRKSWRDLLMTGLVAVASFSIPVGAVMAVNRWRYGVAVVSDFAEGPFQSAYAALGRVRHQSFRRYLPLPKEVQHRIYAVSPHFAELEPYFEGEPSAGWRSETCRWMGICDEIGAGWMPWALREAADLAGHYRTAREAASFWRAVAAEVEAACESGELVCNHGTGSFLPPWHAEYGPLIASTFQRSVSVLLHFDGLPPEEPRSYGDDRELEHFRDMTRDRLAPGDRVPVIPPRQAVLDRQRAIVLSAAIHMYRAATPIVFWIALVGWLVTAATVLLRHQPAEILVVSSSIFFPLATRLALLSVIEVVAFPTLNGIYLSAAYPLVISFVVVSLMGLLPGARELWASLLRRVRR